MITNNNTTEYGTNNLGVLYRLPILRKGEMNMINMWEKEYYTIYMLCDVYTNTDVKMIKLRGNFYDVGNPGYNENGEKDERYTSRAVDYYESVTFKLKDFIDRFVIGKEDLFSSDEYENRDEYSTDLTPTEAEEIMLNNLSKQLNFSELTIDTPCGDYVERWDKDSELL